MPPCLDIYVLGDHRNQETIARFLSEFAHPTVNNDRAGEELMLIPLGAEVEPNSWDACDWVPISTLDEAVMHGLALPHRAFRFYLKAHDPSLSGAFLGFRPDGRIVFGVSLDDAGEKPENLGRAKTLLSYLAKEYQGTAGYITVEAAAPILGSTFPPSDNQWLVFAWSAGAA